MAPRSWTTASAPSASTAANPPPPVPTNRQRTPAARRAAEIVRRVTDDPDLVPCVGLAPLFPYPVQTDWDEAITLVVIGPVGADFDIEEPIEAKGADLAERVRVDVAGHQGLAYARDGIQLGKEIFDARVDAALDGHAVGP